MSVNKNINNKEGDIKKLDLRGKICPMTFVYTKLAIEELNKGDIIEVVVDFPPAVENIPDSCKRQSLAELLDITEIDSHKKSWRLSLKKL
ncbi:putative sulfur carrier protein [subsurface metagenome]